MKKISFIIFGILLIAIGATGVAFAGNPDAITRITQVFVTNWPSNQNVTVSNTNPIPVIQQTDSVVQKWEYKNLFIYTNTPYLQEYIEEQLNLLGAQGWELVGHSERDTNSSEYDIYSYVFKRTVGQ